MENFLSTQTLSLDQLYLQNRPCTFIIEATGESAHLGIKSRDRLIIDRSLEPLDGQLVLAVVSKQFRLTQFSNDLLLTADPEADDFVWGVVTTILRELAR